MALTKQQKNEIVEEVSDLLKTSKLTVLAAYSGTSVKSMQQLRKEAADNQTVVKVLKNRLVKIALGHSDKLKGVDVANLSGQLLYAFNSSDEAAPAQVLANFAKTNPTLEFVGAITADGQFMSAEDVKEIASLPSKDQLRAQLVGTLAAPLTGFANVMAANVKSILYVLQSRADSIG